MKVVSKELISIVKRFNITVEKSWKKYEIICEQYIDENTGAENVEILDIFDAEWNPIDFNEIAEIDAIFEI